ncbi:MAG: GIY-YIG nuclease family protein [Chromatiales bacterium]|nr:GIY-YIG nuclease family protein [Chromatiales bacterium]
MIDIIELLKLRNFDTNAKTKLVRHQDSRWDLETLLRHDQIEEYQQHQGEHIFKCEYIISFMGIDGSKALFLGIYKVRSVKQSDNHKWSPSYIYQEMNPGKFVYDLQEIQGFEDYKRRLIIDWGKSTRSWHQWLKSKVVTELMPQGKVRPFPGYLDFIIEFNELVKMVKNSDANREWHTMLSSVAGIYLIVDSKTGKQYVGSAYGEKGILGRWGNYARNGHGGNEQLKNLINKSKSYSKYFTFSILRTLPKTLTKREVIEYENLYKTKLGTRTFGLNSN